MLHSIQHIAAELKATREKRGLSQRGLSAKVSVPQGHISRIQNGAVDLKTSSLIELARALDLELMLVPRTLVPTVHGLSRSADRVTGFTAAYRLDEEGPDA